MEDLERQFVESDQENVLLNATFAEVNRLSDENATLRARIKELEGERERLQKDIDRHEEFVRHLVLGQFYAKGQHPQLDYVFAMAQCMLDGKPHTAAREGE